MNETKDKPIVSRSHGELKCQSKSQSQSVLRDLLTQNEFELRAMLVVDGALGAALRAKLAHRQTATGDLLFQTTKRDAMIVGHCALIAGHH